MSLIKELGLLLFTAGQKIEEKAHEYRENREKRFEDFLNTIKEKSTEAEEESSHQSERMKEHARTILSSFGFATKEEIDELKHAINELSAKLDSSKKP